VDILAMISALNLNRVLVRKFCTKSNHVPLRVSVPTGILSGTMGSLCGIGGGAVIIPIFSTFTKLSPKVISATSLFSIVLAASVGAVSYIEQGFPNLPLSFLLTVTSLPTTVVGARLVRTINPNHLRKITGVTMMCCAPAIYFKPNKTTFTGNHLEELRDRNHWRKTLKKENFLDPALFAENLDFVGLGLVSGLLSGLIGIGGGLIMNSYMNIATDMPQHEIISTSLVTIVPIGIMGSCVHIRNGYIALQASASLGLSALTSMYITSRYTHHIDDMTLRKIFAVLLVLGAGKMLI